MGKCHQVQEACLINKGLCVDQYVNCDIQRRNIINRKYTSSQNTYHGLDQAVMEL